MATVYHRDQPGAPVLSYTSAVASAVHFTALKDILKACLVYGYGSIPAAGWSLVNEGSEFIVLRNGTQSGYLCLSFVPGMVEVWLAETYTGMNGNVMTGAGLKSGTAASGSTLLHKVNIAGLAYSSATTSWYMIADARTFVFGCARGTTAADLDTAATTGVGMSILYAGEDSSGWFVAAGGAYAANTSTSNYSSPFNQIDANAITALRNPATGLLVDNGSLTVNTPGLSTTNSTSQLQASAIVLPDASLASLPWCGGGVYAGRFRGLVVVPTLSLTGFSSTAARALGAPALTTRTANTPIDLGDGHAYFVRAAHYYNTFFLVTDNPEFW